MDHECLGECWRVIPRAPCYSVSCIGRVRNDKTGRVLRERINRPGGYVIAALRSGPGGDFLVHRLVYESFVGPIPEGLQVRHFNDVGSDNRLSNIDIGTAKENRQDRTRNGNHSHKLTDEDVAEIRGLRASGLTYAEIGRRFGVTRAAVCHVCLGRRWSHLQPVSPAAPPPPPVPPDWDAPPDHPVGG